MTAANVCRSCGTPRGKRGERSGWSSAVEGTGAVVWTCPECPTAAEAIRRIEQPSGVRFRTVLDVARKGQPRKQETRTFVTLAEAREHVAATRAKVERGEYSAETVTAAVGQWLGTRSDVRAVSRQGYRTALRPVLVFMGDKRVADVRPRDVREFVQWAAREGGARGGALSPRSIRYALTGLGQVLAVAVTDGVLAANPARGVKVPRQASTSASTSEPHYWTREQVATFRAVSDADALAGVFRLSLAGMTRADIHGLRWDDVDMDAGTVRIARGRVALAGKGTAEDEPKSQQRRRTLPVERVERGTVALLRRLRAAQREQQVAAGSAWQASGYVVVNALGEPEHPERYSKRFRKLSADAGLPTIRLHALRHSLAHHFGTIGILPSDGAAWLGHTTAVYLSTYFPERGASGVEQVAAAMERAASA